MSIATAEQAAINRQQADLDKRRNDMQAAATAAQHALGKAVQAKLAGVPMHDTNVGETALIVSIVLDVLGVKIDPKPTAGPAGPTVHR